MMADRRANEDHGYTRSRSVTRAGGSPYKDDDELREAAENLGAYLAILREWDEREKHRRQSDIIEQIHGS